ncbi:hypothetical protein [Paenibacillus bovis]|uniref:Uncharacterized protein n=1 Tax=Paenibacillus bovis TaxID=1616788 RepID=A0A1X9T455_9BACL|nr:hypothetical protein [Paenibacillus bovis]ARR10718.1 hypothetical protein AR543_p0110 [Paenibacillus bovis]
MKRMSTKRIVSLSIAVSLTALFLIFTSATWSGAAPEYREVEGIITDIQDLYTLEEGPASGYYKQMRMLMIGSEVFYLSLAGKSPSSDAYRVQKNQAVTLQVDENRMVKALLIES